MVEATILDCVLGLSLMQARKQISLDGQFLPSFAELQARFSRDPKIAPPVNKFEKGRIGRLNTKQAKKFALPGRSAKYS